MKQRILILGASGFIGNACMRAFQALGHEVKGVGRRAVADGPNYQASSFEAAELRKIVADFGPDVCINAAGSGSPAASVADPGADFAANTVLVHHILDALRLEAPNCRYIGISSAAVYGDSPDVPWTEDVKPSPRSPYGYHKLAGELLTEEYHRLYGLATLNLRVFSVYGPSLRKQLFWDIFQRSRLSGELSLFGTGREMRDYIYIDDLVAAIVLFACEVKCNTETLNVGSGRATSVADASGLFLKELGWQGSYQFTGQEIAGSPLQMEADMTRSFELGFAPKLNLAEGLKRTAEWLKETHHDAD